MFAYSLFTVGSRNMQEVQYHFVKMLQWACFSNEPRLKFSFKLCVIDTNVYV